MIKQLNSILNFIVQTKTGACLTLAFLTFVVFFNILSNDFLFFWDDQWVVMNNYTYMGFTANNLWHVLSEFYHGQYSPVNEIFYILLFLVDGLNPEVFHLASLIVHIVNVLLVFFLVGKILPAVTKFNKRTVRFVAFFTALVFAVHPFNVEAVAWISASKVILFALFYFLAMLVYIRYIETGKIKFYLIALFLFILSFGAKEQAVTLLFSLILLDYAFKRNFKTLKLWLEKIPFLLLSLIFGIVTIYSQGRGLLDSGGYPFYQKIVFASYSLTEYFTKCIIPVKISYLYPFPNKVGEALPADFWLYPAIILTLAVCLISKFKISAHRHIYFSMLFFVANLSVALHLISLSRFAIVADRYVYVASFVIFLEIGILLIAAIKRFPAYKPLIAVCVCLYVIACGTYSYERTKVWHNTDTLKKEIREQLHNRNSE